MRNFVGCRLSDKIAVCKVSGEERLVLEKN